MFFKIRSILFNDFKSNETNNHFFEVEEKIRRELLSNLKYQGVDISRINVDVRTGYLNLSLCIKQ